MNNSVLYLAREYGLSHVCNAKSRGITEKNHLLRAHSVPKSDLYLARTWVYVCNALNRGIPEKKEMFDARASGLIQREKFKFFKQLYIITLQEYFSML